MMTKNTSKQLMRLVSSRFISNDNIWKSSFNPSHI